MKKDIIVNDDKTEVTLCLSLTKRVMARDPKMTITTIMAKIMLENADFKLDKCLKSDIINNHNANSKHDGAWTFSLVRELPAAQVEITKEILNKIPSTKKRTKRSKKTQRQKES